MWGRWRDRQASRQTAEWSGMAAHAQRHTCAVWMGGGAVRKEAPSQRHTCAVSPLLLSQPTAHCGCKGLQQVCETPRPCSTPCAHGSDGSCHTWHVLRLTVCTLMDGNMPCSRTRQERKMCHTGRYWLPQSMQTSRTKGRSRSNEGSPPRPPQPPPHKTLYPPPAPKEKVTITPGTQSSTAAAPSHPPGTGSLPVPAASAVG